jgi:hypothetical protein
MGMGLFYVTVFWCFFLGPGLVLLWAFLKGVLENVRFLCGVLVVNLWWLRGGGWREETMLFSGQKHATDLRFIFGLDVERFALGPGATEVPRQSRIFTLVFGFSRYC